MLWLVVQLPARWSETTGKCIELVGRPRDCRPEFNLPLSGPYQLVALTSKSKHLPLLKQVQYDEIF